MKNKKIGYLIVFLISLVGGLIGWIAWVFVIKGILEFARIKRPGLFSKWYTPASIIMMVSLVFIYGAYQYFVVTPNLPHF